ncbi:MAG: hypothetical protein KDC90_05275 [Ignavibacteriae bacterium]|nr:hypothetical protein [Ignavibacteriota bacterium]
MKYLIILTLLLISTNLVGQTENNNFIDSTKVESSSWAISGGVYLKTFEPGIFRITYLYNLNNIFSLPFEIEYFFGSPIISTSIRSSQKINNITKFYLHGGVGVFLGGIESIAIIPNLNSAFGIMINKYFIELRFLSLISKSEKNSSPGSLFISVGINF